jgi:hypothetical protein
VGSRPSELVQLLMHDARTPLNAVHGFVELLLAGAGGPLSEAALGHLIEIARAGRAIEVAMGLAQQLAEFDPAAMAVDERRVDLALLLAETGFELMPPNGDHGLRAIPVPPAVWRPALDLCRSHLGGGEQPQAAPLAEIVHHAPHTLDLRLHGADMRCGGASSVLVERLLITLLGQAGAVLCSVPPHRPIVIRLMPAASVPAPVRAEACCQRGASAGASAAKTRA